MPITAEISPAVQMPGAMRASNIVPAAYSGSEWMGLRSPTASTNPSMSCSLATRVISAPSPTRMPSIVMPIMWPPWSSGLSSC